MASLDINPEEVIQNLSSQLGTLMSENTVLKMAIAKLQAALAEHDVPAVTVTPEPEEEKKDK
ncbi:MAG: hypothetical protein HOI21_10885 [Bacteroidetes Order II. Incertae sedis bacterium]|jgi:regulator of replication initiation timing|nr:hypothetical protein [Bacteroidetes Order II. bacterium]